jgi:hypothetical protein
MIQRFTILYETLLLMVAFRPTNFFSKKGFLENLIYRLFTFFTTDTPFIKHDSITETESQVLGFSTNPC